MCIRGKDLRLIVALAAIAVLVPTRSIAAPETIIDAVEHVGIDGGYNWSNLSTADPVSFQVSGSVPDGTWGTTQVERSEGVFADSFAMFRSFAQQQGVGTYGWDNFIVTTPTRYSVSGYVSLGTGPYTAAGGGGLFFYTYLCPISYPSNARTGPWNWYAWYSEAFSPSEFPTITVGGSDGLSGPTAGQLTGILDPGTYQWEWSCGINGSGNSDPASVEGEVVLSLSSDVPEPGSLVIWSLVGIAGACGGWVRRRQRSG